MSSVPEKRSEVLDPGSDPDPPISWRSVLAAAATIYAIVFLILNVRNEVTVKFVFFKAETSLIFLILLSMALGALIAVFGPAIWRRRQRLKRLDPDRR